MIVSYRVYDDGDPWNKDDANAWMSQGIPRFADATARSAAIASPATGQFTWLDSPGVLERWSGSAWITYAPIPPGGTTGQVLTKASGTDYDYGWVTP